MVEIFTVHCRSRVNEAEWKRQFEKQIEAELFIKESKAHPDFVVTGQDFESKYSVAELIEWRENRDRILEEARRLQKWALDRTYKNFSHPDLYPCEICGGKHPNYKCCYDCDYGAHKCHACGDDLGHKEYSVCYFED